MDECLLFLEAALTFLLLESPQIKCSESQDLPVTFLWGWLLNT